MIILILGFTTVKAQNYIYNPCFDKHYLWCPDGAFSGPNGNVIPWETYCCAAIYDTCATYYPNGPSTHLPQNFHFYQNSISGNSFAGLYTYADTALGAGKARGYLYQKFRKPLVQGKRYHNGYHVNLADKSMYATNSLGAYLSASIPIFDTILLFFHQTMQMINTTLNLTDTMRWQK